MPDQFAFALAQLRHLYAQMLAGHVHDTAAAARGLLGPSIARLERLSEERRPVAGMKLDTFQLDLRDATPTDHAAATFYSLVTSGWTLYSMALAAYGSKGVDVRALDVETKTKDAMSAFDFVVKKLPAGPYRRELERFRAEIVPAMIAYFDGDDGNPV